MKKQIVALVMLFSTSSVSPAEKCLLNNGIWQGMEPLLLRLYSDVGTQTIAVNVADDDQERQTGYQWLCPQATHNTAVLFVFEQEVSVPFHMHNVHVSLKIGFFNAAGKLVDTQHMQPYNNLASSVPAYYRSKAPFQYVLEIPHSKSAQKLMQLPGLRLDTTAITIPQGSRHTKNTD